MDCRPIVVGCRRGSTDRRPGRRRTCRRFVDAVARRTTIPVLEADERLTSREAESRLAVRERDWRKRKAQLDAAAAAIILQDYLDRRRRQGWTIEETRRSSVLVAVVRRRCGRRVSATLPAARAVSRLLGAPSSSSRFRQASGPRAIGERLSRRRRRPRRADVPAGALAERPRAPAEGRRVPLRSPDDAARGARQDRARRRRPAHASRSPKG